MKRFLGICLAICVIFGMNVPGAAAADGQATGGQDEGWVDIFNGVDLTGWKVPNFGGEGEVTVDDGIMTIGMGAMVSGVAYTGEFLPRSNFEIEVVARRTMGFDFIAAITFPIGDGFATFINGGWGGGVFGLSCIDGFDASENDTMCLLTTENDVWYTYRVRVTNERVQCFVDGKEVVNRARDASTFSTRFEVEYTRPLGVSNYCSETQVKSIRYRLL